MKLSNLVRQRESPKSQRDLMIDFINVISLRSASHRNQEWFQTRPARDAD